MPKNLHKINRKSRYTYDTITKRFGIPRKLLDEWVETGALITRLVDIGYPATRILGQALINAIQINRPDWWQDAMRNEEKP